MRILIVDDEELSLQDTYDVVCRVSPDSEYKLFRFSDDVLQYLAQESADVVFLDIEMPGADGLTLAGEIKLRCPHCNIIFLTGYPHYALEAHGLYVSGFLLKPAVEEKVCRSLQNLRHPPAEETGRVRAQAFGSFELFVDGKPFRFSRSRSKEMLAYLVDRQGAAATIAEIAAVLFEDRPDSRSVRQQVQVFVQQMMSDLRQASVQDIIVKQHNSIAVDVSRFQCDFYDFLAMKPDGVNAYRGEYMTNYSWAEFTASRLAGSEP